MGKGNFAFLGCIVAGSAAVFAACGGSTDDQQIKSSTNGSGGGGASSASTASAMGGAGGATSSSAKSSTSASAGGAMDAGPDNGNPSDMYPAPHPKPPQVIDLGGKTLVTPKYQPVFFSNDDTTNTTPAIADFVNKVGATNYWATNVSEYGVGAATSLTPVNLAEAAPATIDDTAIQTWLAGKLTMGGADYDPNFAQPDGQTVYSIFYPANTTVTLSGQQSCQAFGGYHSDFSFMGQDVAYLVVPRCDAFGDLMGLDAITGPASHEMIEAATDPHPMTDPAYAQVDDNDIYWLRALGGGEIGDMCAQNQGAFTTFPELSYAVQRCWSNKAALAGHDPCVPALPGEVYYNAAPVLPDVIQYSAGGQMVSLKGVKIAVGQSKTIDVQLFSDGDTGGPWKVHADDAHALLTGQSPYLSFAWDNQEGQNGQTLHLTITVIAEGKRPQEQFFLVSELNGQQNLWIGVVGN